MELEKDEYVDGLKVMLPETKELLKTCNELLEQDKFSKKHLGDFYQMTIFFNHLMQNLISDSTNEQNDPVCMPIEVVQGQKDNKSEENTKEEEAMAPPQVKTEKTKKKAETSAKKTAKKESTKPKSRKIFQSTNESAKFGGEIVLDED